MKVFKNLFWTECPILTNLRQQSWKSLVERSYGTVSQVLKWKGQETPKIHFDKKWENRIEVNIFVGFFI